MSRYVDGFVLPVPRENMTAYRRMAQKAGKVWREHGAVEYIECVGDDVKPGKWTSFPQSVKLKPGEAVVFAYVVYKSRAHRDSVNAKAMKDPRLASMMDPKALPFDGKRMFWGGFKSLVETVRESARVSPLFAGTVVETSSNGTVLGRCICVTP